MCQVVVGNLSKPAATANKSVYITSFTPTQNEILAILEAETEEKWNVEKITTADAKVQGFETLRKGDMSRVVGIIMASTYDPANGNDFTKKAVLSNALLGLPKKGFQDCDKGYYRGEGRLSLHASC